MLVVRLGLAQPLGLRTRMGLGIPRRLLLGTEPRIPGRLLGAGNSRWLGPGSRLGLGLAPRLGLAPLVIGLG